MKVLIGGEWVDGYLDEALFGTRVRIEVMTWRRHQRLDDVYWPRSASVRNVASYVRKVGPREVVRKIRSRLAERARNDRYFVSGCGRVMESGPDASLSEGTMVEFLAPCHAAGMERVVLDERLVRAATVADQPGVTVLDAAALDAGDVRGWRPESGSDLDAGAVERLLADARGGTSKRHDLVRRGDVVTEFRQIAAPEQDAEVLPTASMFGLGNYAKTIIMPSVEPLVRMEAIHEIDPLQIGNEPAAGPRWDTLPSFREDERPDLVFIASFHHSHTDLALEAARRGAKVLIEKPAATTRSQIDLLDELLTTSDAVVHLGFHRRWLPFNDWIHEDLGTKIGDPIDYYCLVYEEPVPTLHWYGWPNSRTRLTSNGCHWIDHFLFLNGYPEIVEKSVVVAANGTLTVMMEADNGAVFSMTLTDIGSARLGVRDHVECRHGSGTVTFSGSGTYESESATKVLRRKRLPALVGHRIMYERIVTDMLAGQPGETTTTALAAARLCLELEESIS